MKMNFFRVCHLSSVHPRNDTRIFYKMCASLANSGYEVTLVVADGKGDETNSGVAIHDVGSPRGRFDRMRHVPKRVFAKAVELNADLYHLHDPELIPIGLKLKRLGKKVIFDSHEDVPKQLLSKSYLNPVLLRMLSLVYAQFECFACARFDAIVAATPFIRNKFLKVNPRTVDINNFPILGELATPIGHTESRAKICYVGGITEIRGIRETVCAMDLLNSDIRLDIAGNFLDAELGAEMRQHPGWKRVNELGFIGRQDVRKVLSQSSMGLVTLHPTINYIDALPVKMFEYMSAGIAVIASDFPLWREIIEGNGCGMCVDPLNPQAIAAAIDTLSQNPDRARKMGKNGQRAVQERYNWKVEEQKLLQLCKELLTD